MTHVIKNSIRKNKQGFKLSINNPLRKELPSFGVAVVNVREINEKDKLLINKMDIKYSEERLCLINEGIGDKMKLQ